MKNLRSIVCIVLFLLTAGTAFSQGKFSGRVSEVIDGKTVVIDSGTQKLTAVLQYIEIPENDQPLHKTVQQHLEKLVLGKNVEFYPHGIQPGKTLGQLYVGDLDIAQQLLRDGGAWHIGLDRSGQDEQGSFAYKHSQEQARGEKRGVWSVPTMKPAWEFRAEKEVFRKQQEQLKQQLASGTNSNQTAPISIAKNHSKARTKVWADTNPALGSVGALLNGYNAEKKTGYISTPLLPIAGLEKTGEVQEPSAPQQPGSMRPLSALEFTYIYKEGGSKGRTGIYVIGLNSYSREWRFLKSNSLVVSADEKKLFAAKAKRTTAGDGDLLKERLTFEVRRSDVEAIANGSDVILKVGDYAVTPTHGLQMLLYNLLQATR